MSVWVESVAIPSYAGVTIRNQLYQKVGNKKLMVLLPGRGYTIAAPLLYYNFKLGWSNGYDVLRVEYGFHVAQSALAQDNIPDITQESTLAVEKALEADDYEELVIVGKSLGTPIAALIANQHPITTKCLLLTPIQSSHKIVEKAPTLAIIGTSDPLYDAEATVDTDWVTWKVYPDLDHSLEKRGDLNASLAILPDIIQTCADFILR